MTFLLPRRFLSRPIILIVLATFCVVIFLWNTTDDPRIFIPSKPSWAEQFRPYPPPPPPSEGKNNSPPLPPPPHPHPHPRPPQQPAHSRPHGTAPPPPAPHPPTPAENALWLGRREQVKSAFKHAYSGYIKHAFPNDELLPISGKTTNKFNGWGVTLVDSMDTMWIMGLEEEFEHAVGVVAKADFMTGTTGGVVAPFFETIIRYLGSLLSSHALSKNPVLLTRAADLGTLLLPAFYATPASGLPAFGVDTRTGQTAWGWMGSDTVLLSEAGSCQLEYKYLAKVTGKREFYDVVEKVMRVFYESEQSEEGIFANEWSPGSGTPKQYSYYSTGASADSFYEYLLKQYLISGDVNALTQYLRSVRSILDEMAYITKDRGLVYLAGLNRETTTATPSGDNGDRRRKRRSTSDNEHLTKRAPPPVRPKQKPAKFQDEFGVGRDSKPRLPPPNSKPKPKVVQHHPPNTSVRHLYEHLSCFFPGVLALGASLIPSSVPFPSSSEDETARMIVYSDEEREEHMWAARALARTCWMGYADMESGLGADGMMMGSGNGRGNGNGNGRGGGSGEGTRKWVEVVEEWRKQGGGGGVPPGVEDFVDTNGAGDEAAHLGSVEKSGRVGYDFNVNAEANGYGEQLVSGTARNATVRSGTGDREYATAADVYLLRPETVETLYILYKTTGERVWRDRAWAIFEAIEKHAKTPMGYAIVESLDKETVKLGDDMPSFFLAETLKYLYLMFSPPPVHQNTGDGEGEEDHIPYPGTNTFRPRVSHHGPDGPPAITTSTPARAKPEEDLDLSRWVFNTEAHPLPVFEWDKAEKKAYGIAY